MDFITIIKGSVIGASIGTLFMSVFKSYLDELIKSHFKDKEENKKQKKQLISEIKDIVLEGQTAGWRVQITNWKPIYKMILDISEYDDILSSKLTEYVGLWGIFSFGDAGEHSVQYTQYLIETKQELITLSDSILSRLKNI